MRGPSVRIHWDIGRRSVRAARLGVDLGSRRWASAATGLLDMGTTCHRGLLLFGGLQGWTCRSGTTEARCWLTAAQVRGGAHRHVSWDRASRSTPWVLQ